MVYVDYAAWLVGAVAAPAERILEVFGQLSPLPSHTNLSVVYLYDLVQQRTLCASHSISAMLGYTNDDIHQMGTVGLANLIHPDDLKSVSEHYQRFTTLSEGQVISIDYRMKRADGTWTWLRSREALLMQTIEGIPLHVLGIVQDITTQLYQEGLWRAFSDLLEQRLEMVMITDQLGRILYVNSVFEQVTGYSQVEVLGKTPALLKSGQHNTAFYRHLWNMLQSGQPFQAEFVNRKKNGDLFREDKSIIPIQHQGQIMNFISLSRWVGDLSLESVSTQDQFSGMLGI